MPARTEAPDAARAAPRAVRELAGMFDDVAGRYDFLNAVMSLGQDGAWRAAMWRAVPEDARAVLDLCTGSGASLAGLLRPGRLVLGVDASAAMLELAAEGYGGTGWAARFACADAFRLPLRDSALDAVTIAFGARNLRPRLEALREMARVLRPGGTLVVLEALAPRRGVVAPLHAFYLRALVPLAGRLSSDPSAYRYLSQSIFEFGDGEGFGRDLEVAGFAIASRRTFLMGATGLWIARRGGDGPPGSVTTPGEKAATSPSALQNARPGGGLRGLSAHPAAAREQEWRIWTLTQLGFALALVATLAWALRSYVNYGSRMPLEAWARRSLGALIVLGLIGFAVRALVLALRLQGRAPRRRP